jgi:hypothetical protein
MERSQEYEPIILDLQKSKSLRQSKRYALLVIVSAVIGLGTLATFAAFYYPKSSSTHRSVVLPTPVPQSTPSAAITPTPVSAVAKPEPTPTVRPTVTVTEPTGTLNLYSHPSGADIVIDGKLIGRTPLLNYELKPGTYAVKFSHQGVTSEHKMTITAGKTTEYTHRFEGFGSLSIKTTSSGGDVFVNGTLAGQSPLLLEGLAPGTYKIVVSKKGYTTADKTVILGKGEHQELLITIKRLDLIIGPDRGATPIPPRPRPVHPSERLQP